MTAISPRARLHRATVILASAALSAGAGLLGVAISATPSAADTQSFTTPGNTLFTFPPGVTNVTFTIRGAGGRGAADRGTAGSGGSVTATLTGKPCTTLLISVGGSGFNGGPGGGGRSGVFDTSGKFILLGAGGGGGPGQNGSTSGAGGNGGDGGGGAPFTLPPGPSGVGGTGRLGGDGTQGAVSGGFPGLGGTSSARGADGNGVNGGSNGSNGNSGAGANGGGRGGGGGAGLFGGGGGGGGGTALEGGGGGGGGSSFVLTGAQNVSFGTGAGPGLDGSVTVAFSAPSGTCAPAPVVVGPRFTG